MRREPDTISLMMPSPSEKELLFGWQFGPLRAARRWRPGTRQMLAVISIKEPDCEIEHRPEWVDIEVEVRSYWRRFNASTQTVSAATGWRTLLSNAPTEAGLEEPAAGSRAHQPRH